MGLSNYLVGILNFATALLSIPILVAGIWLATRHSSDCLRFLQVPIIIIGLLLLLVSIAGLVGASCHVVWLLWLYLAFMFLLILVLLVFTVFAFVVTNKGAGEAVSGKGFKEYHLGNYSTWLQKRVNNNWDTIRACLSDAQVCKSLNSSYPTVSDFNKASLTPLESGCCKPPSACQFTFVTAIDWTNAQNPSADPDCKTWSNNSTQLCFSCNSCRAGGLEDVKKDWRKVAIINVVMLAIIIAIYTVGCSAFRNAQKYS